MELGVSTFADTRSAPGGEPANPARRLRELLEEIELAEQVGLDVFGVGEHHRPDFAVSAPAVVLAAVAARTERIRLTSAVTVLSSDDPVRVFQDFATVDLLSGGRAEIMAGRGSFIESFPLFGYDLADYDELFAEKLELLLQLRESERVTWAGQHRVALDDQGVYPRPVQEPLPVWIAVGGTPESAVRAGTLGLPMALAIIGGMPERFVPLRGAVPEGGARGRSRPAAALGVNSHAYVAETSERAADEFFPAYAAMMNAHRPRARLVADRAAASSTQLRGPRGALAVGSPEEVAEKILFEHELFGHDRFLAQISVGTLPHEQALRAIELFGTEVAPLVRARLGQS